MKRVLLFFPIFFVSCGFINTQQVERSPKKITFYTDLKREYFKTLNTQCALTVEDALKYEYALTGDESYLEKLQNLPQSCRKLLISKNELIVQNLPQKEEDCFPGVEFKKGKEAVEETLNERVDEVLKENFCY